MFSLYFLAVISIKRFENEKNPIDVFALIVAKKIRQTFGLACCVILS